MPAILPALAGFGAATWATATGFTIFVNGNKGTVSTDGTALQTGTNLQIGGRGAGDSQADGEIKNVKISRTEDGIKFEFYCERHDKEVKPGIQQDLIDKLQKRVDKYHKNFITNVEILVYQE